jgi:para-nitrobenzyl esterase
MQVEPLIPTTNGTFRGRALANGGYCFAGIPFAAPPIGPLRFRPPQPDRLGITSSDRRRAAHVERHRAGECELPRWCSGLLTPGRSR